MEIEIVPGHDQYIESFFECFDEVAKERRFLSFLEAPPKNEVAEFARKKIVQGHTLFYALEQGQVVGWCDILRKGVSSQRHSGVLGIGIKRGFRGNGIGKSLMKAAILDAQNKGIQRIELWVFENNRPAISLYETLGFKIEGRMDDYIKIDGVFYDALMMSKIKR
jgi:ribosomal protein S18 acetylase RimI-like enzyme